MLAIALAVGLAVSARGAGADPPPLGLAEPFAVLAGATVTNVGPTIIFGNLGVSPGTAVTGNPDVRGEIHTGPTSPAAGAQTDARAAYVHLFNEPCPPGNDLTGTDLGGRTLAPGVYCFSSEAQLTGTLTLDFEGNPNALFVFKIGTMLTTASGSEVRVINAGGETNPCNVFWQVGSSATLGTNSVFLGTIIADQSITANSGTEVMGRLLALVGQVSLNDNTVTRPACAPTTTTTVPTTTTTVPTTTTTVPTTTTTIPPTTTTIPPTTTTVPPTTTTAPATTTTVPPTTTTIPPTTTTVPATTTTIPPTTTTAPATTTTATDQPSPGAITTVSPGATTASPGVLLTPAQAGLETSALARTGQGFSGPLSVAIVSIFLGALLLLAHRRGGVPAMAVPQGPGAGQSTPGAARYHEPVGQVGTSGPRSGDLMEALERQLQEADARLARLRAMRRS